MQKGTTKVRAVTKTSDKADSEQSTTRDRATVPTSERSRHGEGVRIRNIRVTGNENGCNSEERQLKALVGSPSPPSAEQVENTQEAYGRPEQHPAARTTPCRHHAAPTPQSGRPPGQCGPLTQAGRMAGLQTRADMLLNDRSQKGYVL